MSKIIESISEAEEFEAVKSLLINNEKWLKLTFDKYAEQLKTFDLSKEYYSVDKKVDFIKIEEIMDEMRVKQEQYNKNNIALDGLKKVSRLMFMPITPENNEEIINLINEKARDAWVNYKNQNEGYNYVMNMISQDYYSKKDESIYFNEKMLIERIKNDYLNAKDEQSKKIAIQEMLYIEQLSKNPMYADRFSILDSAATPKM